jgi:hypothetical protein
LGSAFRACRSGSGQSRSKIEFQPFSPILFVIFSNIITPFVPLLININGINHILTIKVITELNL